MPRYRQRVRSVPGQLANPVWVDDDDFDLGLPRTPLGAAAPGQPSTSCASWSARIMSRPLDRHRPLWEIYFVEGLEGGRVALLSKSHQVLVDGVAHRRPRPGAARPSTPSPRSSVHDDWRPQPRAVAGRPGRGRGRATRCADPRHRARHRPRRRRRVRCATRRTRSPRRVGDGRRRAVQPPARPRSTPISGDAVAAAPLRDRARPRSPTTASPRRRTAAPSTTSSSPPSPARCAAG